MEITLTTTPAASVEAGALVALVFSTAKNDEAKIADTPTETSPANLDVLTGGWVSELNANKEFSGKALDMAMLHRPAGLKATRLLLAGAGLKSKFGASEARKLAGAVLRKLKGKGVSDFALCLDGDVASEAFVEAFAEGFILGDFEPDALKTDPKKDEKKVERIQLSLPAAPASLVEVLRRGRIVAEAQNFLDFIGDATLVIHNAPFDMGFLDAELERVRRGRLTNEVIDTVMLARNVHPGARVSLDALCKHYGIDNSRRALHGALLDSEILAEVYLELIGGRQVALALVAETRIQSGIKVELMPARRRPEALPPRLTEAERAVHAMFVGTLGADALWQSYRDQIAA